MRVAAALLTLLVASTSAADATLATGALDRIAVDADQHNALPLTLEFVDDAGTQRSLGDVLGDRPAILIFADYTCHTLCGPIVEFATAGLEATNLHAGTDYHLLVIGLDPKDSLAQARSMKSARVGTNTPIADATIFLSGSESAIRVATRAVGYRYDYDAEHDQFAHPAVAFAVNPQGRVTRALSGLGLTSSDLQLALVEAGEGKVGSFSDHLSLLCYGYDPVHGIYTASIERWLAIGVIATMATMCGGIVLMIRMASRRASP